MVLPFVLKHLKSEDSFKPHPCRLRLQQCRKWQMETARQRPESASYSSCPANEKRARLLGFSFRRLIDIGIYLSVF